MGLGAGPGLSPSHCRRALRTLRRTLAAVPTSSSLVKLSWQDRSNTESGFRVERSIDGSTFTTIATLSVNDRDYDDTSVAPSTAYTYRVVAFNDAGDSTSAATPASTPRRRRRETI